jgi:serine protease Do
MMSRTNGIAIATRRSLLQGVACLTVLPMLIGRAAAVEPLVGLADLVAQLLPSVVSIRTVVTSPSGDLSFVGSGFVVTTGGVIATNRHVVVGATKITVTVPNLGDLAATPLYVAEYLDFALLKVEPPAPMKAATFGDSDAVRVGDTVLLLGNPMGIGESLSVGVISALNRDIGEGRFDRFFQTDAAINHGNSGGPMFNLKGEVIAINTGLESSPGNSGSIGIGFSLPINDVKLVIDQYLRDGKVVVGSTGVRAQRMTATMAAAFGTNNADGSIVTEVLPGGSAVGKLRPGDIMLKVGPQDATDTSAVARLIATSAAGTALTVVFLRDGMQHSTTVTISREEIEPLKAMALSGRSSREAVKFMTPSAPGFGMAPIGPAERARFVLDARAHGVVVTQVDPRGAASRELEAGDVILSVDSNAVTEPADVAETLRAVSASHRAYAAFLVSGERGTRWVALPLQTSR